MNTEAASLPAHADDPPQVGKGVRGAKNELQAGVAGRGGNLEVVIWGLLIVASAALLGTSVYRAATFPFTHDESLSFTLLSGPLPAGSRANDHVLNTLLMGVSAGVFGASQFSLRIPSLLAHVIYLGAGLLVLRRVRSQVLRVFGFVLLNLNPFMLDYFFLARGYGLALGFTLLSIYWLLVAYEHKREAGRGFVFYLFLSVMAGSLGLVANFAFLNFYLPLLVVIGWMLFTDGSLRRWAWGQIGAAVVMFGGCGVFLFFVLRKMIELKKGGELYDGGSTGFIKDTLASLVDSTRYGVHLLPGVTDERLTWVIVGVVAGVFLLGEWVWWVRKQGPFFVFCVLLLIGAGALPMVGHRVSGILYPRGRMALYYLPVFSVMVLFTFDYLQRGAGRGWQRVVVAGIAAVVAMGFAWHFCRSFNPHTTLMWGFDGHDAEVMEILDRDHRAFFPGDRTIRLGNNWLFRPSMNFYRVTRGYGWLAEVTSEPITEPGWDYIYAFESDIAKTPIAGAVRMVAYKDTGTVLLRVLRGAGR